MKFSDLDRMSLADFIAGAPENALWFFLHIPKTAGSSFAAELNRHATPYRNVFVDYENTRLTAAEAQIAVMDEFIADPEFRAYRSASGHMPWYAARRLREARGDTQYFTILREPIARVVSDYRYQRTPAHPPYRKFIADFPTLESFAETHNARDKMARHITGKPHPGIEETLRMVDEAFAFVGLLEMYPMTLNTVFALMGVPGQMPQEHQRRTPDSEVTHVDLTPELSDWIADLNPVDAALYAHVRQRLAPHQAAWTPPPQAAESSGGAGAGG